MGIKPHFAVGDDCSGYAHACFVLPESLQERQLSTISLSRVAAEPSPTEFWDFKINGMWP